MSTHFGRNIFGTFFWSLAVVCSPLAGWFSALLTAAKRASGRSGGAGGCRQRVGAGSSPGTPPNSTAALAASPAEAAQHRVLPSFHAIGTRSKIRSKLHMMTTAAYECCCAAATQQLQRLVVDSRRRSPR